MRFIILISALSIICACTKPQSEVEVVVEMVGPVKYPGTFKAFIDSAQIASGNLTISGNFSKRFGYKPLNKDYAFSIVKENKYDTGFIVFKWKSQSLVLKTDSFWVDSNMTNLITFVNH